MFIIECWKHISVECDWWYRSVFIERTRYKLSFTWLYVQQRTAWECISSYYLVLQNKLPGQFISSGEIVHFHRKSIDLCVIFLKVFDGVIHCDYTIMSIMLRNIVRSNALKSLVGSAQQSVGIRAVGSRSLWHMSKPSSATINGHRCSGFGCSTCGKRFSSTNGKAFFFVFEFFWISIETQFEWISAWVLHNLKLNVTIRFLIRMFFICFVVLDLWYIQPRKRWLNSCKKKLKQKRAHWLDIFHHSWTVSK